MAGFEEFNDRDWREVFAELRLMVVSAGFSEWDTAAAAALDESKDERVDRRPRDQVLRYVRSFGSFLKVRSKENLDRMRSELGEILQSQDGEPVFQAEVPDLYDGRAGDILEGNASDELLNVVSAFANAVEGEDGYFDDDGADL